MPSCLVLYPQSPYTKYLDLRGRYQYIEVLLLEALTQFIIILDSILETPMRLPDSVFQSYLSRGVCRSINRQNVFFPLYWKNTIDKAWVHRILKALANEDTLLRTHCCRHKCFPVCLHGQHLLRTQHKKCFWFCSETFCVRNKCFPVCAAQETT